MNNAPAFEIRKDSKTVTVTRTFETEAEATQNLIEEWGRLRPDATVESILRSLGAELINNP
jgi:hypothetical protein